MRLSLAIAAIVACAVPAQAADLSGEIGLASDYRYRGLSLSAGRPVLQGSLTVEHGSGLYAEVWASTLGSAELAEAEIDFTAGYARDLGEHFSVELSANYFAYPAASSDNYFEVSAMATAARGNASASLGISYVPGQRATRDDAGRRHDNGYLFGAVDYALQQAPVTLKASLGYEHGAFDEVERGGKWDWSAGGEIALAPARLGLSFVGSNADDADRALVASLFLGW